MRISVIVPVHNAGQDLKQVLGAIKSSNIPDLELVVVDDCSSDDSLITAKKFTDIVLTNNACLGPAQARNQGAERSHGDILVFIDSDVLIRPDTLASIVNEMNAHPDIAAVFGSYDDEPQHKNFFSLYKNLFHHFVHQGSSVDARTFWAGCGAVRRSAFFKAGGFPRDFKTSSIEDVVLGYKLIDKGFKIRLLKDLKVKHLKKWSLGSVLKTDIFSRAIPWTRLALEKGLPRDLNFRFTDRVSAIAAWVFVAGLCLLATYLIFPFLAALSAIILIIYNRKLYSFFYRKGGLLFCIGSVLFHWFYFIYSSFVFCAVAMLRKPILFHIILIAALGVLVYLPSRHGAFIWDDNALIRDNFYVRGWSNFSRVFTHHTSADAMNRFIPYRPFVTLTYIADYSFWKLNPLGYHLTNIALHVLVSVCLYWFLSILFKNARLSLITSLFYLVHPVHVEAVAYISGRNDMLAFLFMILTFIIYRKRKEKRHPTSYILMVLSFCLALLSKENALVLPLLILFYHYAFKSKARVRDLLSLACLSSVFLVLKLSVLKASLIKVSAAQTFLDRVPGIFVAFLNYVRLLVLPFDLHMDYGKRSFSFMDPWVFLGMAAALSLLVFAFRRRKADPFLFFSVGWFFIAFIPVSNIYPLPFFMAEHWLYVPSVGFFLLLARATLDFMKKDRLRIYAWIFCVALVCSWSALTIKQIGYWREPVSFYQRTLKYNPENGTIYNNLGQAYEERGDVNEAIAAFKKSVELNPDYIKPYINLALLYDKNNSREEAVEVLLKAIEKNPYYPDSYNNLAAIYATSGKPEEAILLLKKTAALRPDYATAHYNLGNVYFDLGNYDEAIKAYKEALRLIPGYSKVLNNLALTYRLKKEENK